MLIAGDSKAIYPSLESAPVYKRIDPLAKIGDYPYPTNPFNDRAKGYLLQGKVKNAVTNFNFDLDLGDKFSLVSHDFSDQVNDNFMEMQSYDQLSNKAYFGGLLLTSNDNYPVPQIYKI